jgi:hypothetical protein
MTLLRPALLLAIVCLVTACGGASIRAIPSWSGPTAEGSGAGTGWFVAKSGRYVTVIHCETTPGGLECAAQTIDPETAQVIDGR